jgi:hypothetical protein
MDPVTQVLTQYGAVGLLALVGLIGIRWLSQKWETSRAQELQVRDREVTRLEETLQRANARADANAAALDALNETVRNVYLDQISKSTQAIGEAGRTVADALAAIRRS